MKYHWFIVLIFLFATSVYSQEYSTLVIDSATLEPIPFYNVDCGKQFDFGDEQGFFKLDSARTCTISCIGYNFKVVHIGYQRDTIHLRPRVNDLKEVQVVGSRSTKTQKVGPIDEFQLFPSSSTIRGHWYRGSILVYISNEDSLAGKIKSILVPLKKRCKFLYYRISLLSVNSYLRPSGFLLNKDIVLKGNELGDKVDILKYNIDFPKDGLFIRFDWYLPENEKRQIQDLKKKQQLDTNCLVIPMAKNEEDPRVYVRFGEIEIYKRTEKEEELGGFIFVPKWGLEILETE